MARSRVRNKHTQAHTHTHAQRHMSRGREGVEGVCESEFGVGLMGMAGVHDVHERARL
jgi:hypothetical protein